MKKLSIVSLALSLVLVVPLSLLAQSSGLIGAGEKLTQQFGFWGLLIFLVIFGLILYSAFKDKQS